PGRIIVIDAKYYREALSRRFDREKVRSAHLYQVFTYLENLKPIVRDQLEGMLIYPVVERPFSYHYRLVGQRIRVVGIDLDQPWQMIRSDLLNIVSDAQVRV